MNNTELEEVATLMRRNTAVRAIYIGPNSEAMLRSIETGIDDVHLELGRNLDFARAPI